jgi:predicted deacylase
MLKKAAAFFIIITFCSSLILITSHANAGTWDPYHTKAEKVAMWKALWDSKGLQYQSVGKSYLGNDILAFTAGNKSAPCIILDGELHGNEDYTSEILYLMANWLLNGSSQANTVLQKLYIVFVPIVDVDVFARGNADLVNSKYGVNLNRNFATGWVNTSAKTDGYGGASPLSEPESRALVNAFTLFKPVVYINLHQGDRPSAGYYYKSNSSYVSTITSQVKSLAKLQGITSFSMSSIKGNGYAIGDAVSNGAKVAWLIEVCNTWRHSASLYNSISSTIEPKCRLFMIAASAISS